MPHFKSLSSSEPSLKYQSTAQGSVISKNGIENKAVVDWIKHEHPDKISWDCDPVELIWHVWGLKPTDIHHNAHLMMEILSTTDQYTVVKKLAKAYCDASEQKHYYASLFRFLESLHRQLFGDPDPDAQSSSRMLRDLSSNRVENALSKRPASRNTLMTNVPKIDRPLDSQFLHMKNRIVSGRYYCARPIVMFSTNEGGQSQDWSWSLASVEVKKGECEWIWGEEDIKIDLDGLKHRYLRDYSQCIARAGEKRKRDDKVDPEMIKSGKRALLSAENMTEATNTQESLRRGNAREDTTNKDCKGCESDSIKRLDLTDNEAQMLTHINEQMSHNVCLYGSGILFRDMTLQLWYADRMGIIVSRPIHMIEEPKLLLYTMAAMGQADIHQMGICHLMEFNTSKWEFMTYQDAKLVLGVDQDIRDSGGEDVREPLEFEVTAKNENNVFTDFGIVGRGTMVIPIWATGHAVNVCGSGELVAKFAWPVKCQNRDETECIRRIRNELHKKKPSVLKHIVELKCHMSREIDKLELPRTYLGTRVLDERIFCTMILRKYDRLEAMDNAAEFKIIFIDAIRGASVVYCATGIKQQHLSMIRKSRKIKTNLLADGSFTPKNVGKPSPSEAQDVPETGSGAAELELPPEPLRYRTGTAPFMAVDLLAEGSMSAHRYHHDLESFFYLLVYVCATFDVKQHRLGHIYEWESANLAQVGKKKETFLKNPVVFNDTFQNQTDPGLKHLTEDWARLLKIMFFKIAHKSSDIMSLREHQDYLVRYRLSDEKRRKQSIPDEHEIQSQI
ncbi:hypothetical protein WOLCODRAFT_167992 [Wolfiporia cocos MD-104 SS10]|uniref:Fungal-type protein kinase domain-containing protein n=1 Tax=Wolfiporia cocos (strain MD-104) TaxID=742152 RepID=A0A2H3JTT8_WOLCO|nr:hypothetical protein WOLCODRAFT_167992 [Wolfiporia cocos MD-104 SS10]